MSLKAYSTRLNRIEEKVSAARNPKPSLAERLAEARMRFESGISQTVSEQHVSELEGMKNPMAQRLARAYRRIYPDLSKHPVEA